jgi:alpha-tubulin suppressor-like RCC1 family protein
VNVVGIGDAVALAVGGAHTCALLADDSLRCWGCNGSGALGDGTSTNRSTPVMVVGL